MPNPRDLGAACDLCPLQGKTPVFGAPPPSGKVRLIVVEEGPGRKQEAGGILQVSAPTALLHETLASAGIDRDDCYRTMAHMCRSESEKESTAAAKCCAPRLYREIAKIPDAPILALGKEPARSLLGVSSIVLTRGFVWTAPDVGKQATAARKLWEKDAGNLAKELKAASLAGRQALAGRTVFPTVDPGFVLKADAWRSIFQIDVGRVGRLSTDGGDYSNLDSAHRRVKAPQELLGPNTWWAGSDPEEVKEAMATLRGDEVSCDIETTITPSVLTSDIVCVGLGDGCRTLIIDPWIPAVHAPLVSELFKGRRVLGHNFINFDMVALQRDGVAFDHVPDDTLLAHHAFASHFPQKLDQVVSEFADSVPWKVVFGRRGAGIGGEKGGLPPAEMEPEERDFYCATDAKLTMLCWQRMREDLRPEREVYEADKKLAMLCQGMQIAGIGFDGDAAEALEGKLKKRKAALKGKMRNLLRTPKFSPRRPGDVKKALYTTLGAPVLHRSEKTGEPQTGEQVLEGFTDSQGALGRFAQYMMTYRLVDKVERTYVAPVPVLADGRAHYSWKAHGTVSGRLACRLQSCPRQPSKAKPEQQVRSLYVATGKLPTATLVAQIHDAAIFEVGDKLVYFDLSQAEARMAAYLSGDPELIRAVEYDIHTENAKLLFSGMPGAADRLARANEKSPSGKKWKSLSRAEGGCSEERDVTKNAGFCVWYVGEAKKVYETLNNKGFPIPLRVCQIFYDRCHDKYWRYYQYVQKNLELVRKQGYMRTAITGRYRHLGYYAPITEVANYSIQAGIAEVMNERLVRLTDQVRGLSDAEEVKAAITRMWAEPVVLPAGPIVSEERKFVLPAEIKIGRKWSEL